MSQNTAQKATVRRFLFLQGPHGPFFSNLAQKLQQDGHTVRRINFNGGDKVDWHAGYATDYTGLASDWEAHLRHYLVWNEITDVVFYGYWRPIHQTATALVKDLGLRQHGFEEGLLRPHWVTVDAALPCVQAEGIREYFANLKTLPVIAPGAVSGAPTLKNGQFWMVMRCIRHYLGIFFHGYRFRHYQTHRPVPPLRESFAWVIQAAKYPWKKMVSSWRLRRALKQTTPFYLLCLQLDGDSQIQKYSSYHGMRDVLREALIAFAQHTPEHTRLVVKNHPLDNGLGRIESYARRAAKELGMAHRLTFLNFGKLAGLVKSAQAMIAVNSSSGLQALYHGCPVRTMGRAAYNLPGLVDNRPWADFFRAPQKPDAHLYASLHLLLVGTTQYAGNFYIPASYPRLIEGCLARLDGADVVKISRPEEGFDTPESPRPAYSLS